MDSAINVMLCSDCNCNRQLICNMNETKNVRNVFLYLI